MPSIYQITGAYNALRYHFIAGMTRAQQRYISSSHNNDNILQNVVNRNPRNMEMLRIANKPLGWVIASPTKEYWYKLTFEQSQRHISARVVHYSGVVVLSASTTEWAIQKHLYSTHDICAAENIGRVIAHRCLQAGIIEVHSNLNSMKENSTKVIKFLSGIQEGGITLNEPRMIREVDLVNYHNNPLVLPWQVTEEDVDKKDQILREQQKTKKGIVDPKTAKL